MSDAVLYDRWVARGKICLKTAFHVGSGQASTLSDMALQRDALGRPYLPGSSLAGLLRATAQNLAPYLFSYQGCTPHQGEPDCPICSLFGYVPPKRQGAVRNNARMGAASRLFVEDGWSLGGLPTIREVRDHVGLNRRRGAAQPQLQYDLEVAPSGSVFHFEISVEDPTANDLHLLLAVLDLWQEYGFEIGGRSTTGLGQGQLQPPTLYGLDFGDAVILRDYLLPPSQEEADSPEQEEYLPPQAELKREVLDQRLGGSPSYIPVQSCAEYLLPQHLFLDLVLAFSEPTLIVGNMPSLEGLRPSEAEPIRTMRADGSDVYLLPGSSLKGVLRTRAEKIMRSLDYYADSGYIDQATANQAWDDESYRGRISACAVTHLQEETGWERLQGCFGSAEAQAGDSTAQEIYRDSCPVCCMFGNSMMRGRLTVGEASPVTSPVAKLFDHVAIDRWSGGAADERKFDTRPLLPGIDSQSLFALRLHLERFEPWMWGLLGLLLKDLRDGDLRLGRATHRGYGQVCGQFGNATALLLPGSRFIKICTRAGLVVEKQVGPYQLVRLGLPTYDDNSPQAKVFKYCHGGFLAEVKRAEEKPHGRLQRGGR